MRKIMVVSDDAGMGKLIADIFQLKRENNVVSIASYDTAPKEIETVGSSLDMAIIDFAAVRSAGSRVMIMDVLILLKGKNPEVVVIGITGDCREERMAENFGVMLIETRNAKSLMSL